MAGKNMIHVVYAFACRDGETRYNAVRVHENVGTIRIHQAIARFENDEQRSGRLWKAPIEAGSFNIMKIAGQETAAEAIRLAEIRGLAYEPKPLVLHRYKDGLSKAREAFENVGRQGRKQQGQSRTSNRSSDFDSIFKDIFGDFMDGTKYGPKR